MEERYMVFQRLRKGCWQGLDMIAEQSYIKFIISSIHSLLYYQLSLQMKPFDIHLIIGTDNSSKQLAKLDVNFELKPENLSKLCHLAEIREPPGQDVIFKFDFSTQEGREKECIQYFQSGLDKEDGGSYDHDLSPLQNWFQRPKKSGKLEIYESTHAEGKGRITLEYRIYKEAIEDDSEVKQLSQKLKNGNFRPDIHFTAEFYGNAEVYKKNRIKLKLDYIEARLTSEEFKMKDFQQLLSVMGLFGEEESTEEMKQHPIFKFLENTEEIQLKLKMASIRKMLQLYEIGLTEEKTIKEIKKGYPEIIKGLFKEEVRVTMVYANTFGFIAKYNFQSEAVFIRMLTGLKKYYHYFE